MIEQMHDAAGVINVHYLLDAQSNDKVMLAHGRSRQRAAPTLLRTVTVT